MGNGKFLASLPILMTNPLDKKYKWRRQEYQEKARGLLMVHTGNGKGKTTCALGLMMRAAGRGLGCCMIQFMKSRNDRYGDHVSAEKLGIEVHTMGDGFTWDTKNPEQDIKTARATWDLCVEKLRSGDYDMLVFDELVYVLSYKMLPVEEVVAEFREIRAAQPALHIVVTGRVAPPASAPNKESIVESQEGKRTTKIKLASVCPFCASLWLLLRFPPFLWPG